MRKYGICLWTIILVVFGISQAFALSQQEWNQQCTNKTISSTPVYTMDASGNLTQTTTLPAGTYVKQAGFDSSSGMWTIYYYTGGSSASGLVEATSITIAISSVTLSDGSVETIPEAMTGDYSAIANYLNSVYSGRTFTAIEGGVTVTGSDDSSSSSRANYVITESELIPVPATLVGIRRLGSYECVVYNGAFEELVETSTIDFSDEMEFSQQLAVIDATRTGVATMHTQPTIKSGVLAKLGTGRVVAVLKRGGNYARIFVDGMVGCVLNDALKILPRYAYPLDQGVITYKGRIIRGEDINVRGGPSAKSRIVETWPTGLVVTVWGKENDFYEIEAYGLRCYINEKFLTLYADGGSDMENRKFDTNAVPANPVNVFGNED